VIGDVQRIARHVLGITHTIACPVNLGDIGKCSIEMDKNTLHVIKTAQIIA
jgi:hypothetical protein